VNSEEWLTLWGVPLEWLLAMFVGVYGCVCGWVGAGVGGERVDSGV